MTEKLNNLAKELSGYIKTDNTHRIIYSTDASAYREKPLAVIYPKNKNDIKKIINFANKNKTPIIPRAAGTSLAGQVVGNGIIIDISKYFTKIIEINPDERYAIVQPGVIRDELNIFAKKYNLFFAPETSTSNRCMLGGMTGNNSCGAHSLIYGSTREHIISIRAILADGSEVEFKNLTKNEFLKKTVGVRLENKIYKQIYDILSSQENQKLITNNFPNPKIKRRNTGYALDILLNTQPFSDTEIPFNFAKLIAGSEGTLAFITEIKVNLTPNPYREKALVCIHLNSVEDALKANIIALKHNPDSIELIDDKILELSKLNTEQNKNRFFIKGNPGAILVVEFMRTSRENILQAAKQMQTEMQENNFGYHFPIIWGNDIKKVWSVRKAGLGLLSNMKGNKKPVPVIEDTAILPEDLPDYIAEFKQILAKYNLQAVYYAHIDTGELHLRPILDLKTTEGQEIFHKIGYDIAILVKKYKGSLSGEHGDGRLRGEFIPLVYGDKIYNIFKDIKNTWDVNNIFNPGKIVDTPKMNSFLRYNPDNKPPKIKTFFDFSDKGGFLETAESCSGSGDCRKTHLSDGVMCPSYQASKNENQSTRARANILREVISNSDKKNPFDSKEIYNILDLCLSCKACKSECPSNVDVTKLKAEFLQHYYETNKIPLRTKLIANLPKINRSFYHLRFFVNLFYNFKFINSFIGFSPKRKIPKIKKSLNSYVKNLKQNKGKNGTVYLLNDEFTNFNDSDIGIKAIKLLNKLGYSVIIPNISESGRTYLSKGLVKNAQEIINKNIETLQNKINNKVPLIGIEPSAILTFRDEAVDLAFDKNKTTANEIAKNSFLIDEFLANEIDKGKITSSQFTDKPAKIKFHGHCYQKSLSSTKYTLKILSLPKNFTVEEIKSGCCGMAGAFGYEKEHYELSMKVGELVLFPEVRKADNETIIAANGTSCRCQIKDGTNKNALHPIEILYQFLL